MTQRDDFVNVQLAVVGYHYAQGGSRCTGANGYFDCSGLQSYAGNKVGLNYGCSNSSTFSRECHSAPRPQWMNNMFGPDPWTGSTTQGTGISIAQALVTRGAWGFHGPDQGENGWGNSGHIKCSLGDGHGAVEAHGSATGVILFPFNDGNLTYCALPPGLTGFETATSHKPNGDPMGMTAAMIVPKAHVLQHGPLKGRYPFVGMILQPNGTTDMVGFNGAKIPHGIEFAGLSIQHMGKLNQPAVSASSPDGKSIVFLAQDGGTFQVYPTVKYP